MTSEITQKEKIIGEGQEGVLEEIKEDRELLPDEVKEYLSRIKRDFCIDLEDRLGVWLVFPEGFAIDGVDVSGKTLKEEEF